MKNAFYFVIIGLFFIALGCSKGDQSYSFSRPTHPQNFKTIKGGELYAYTANDTAVNRADYYMIVEGYVVNYGSEITEYGHCWKANTGTNTTPTINDDRTTFDNPIPAVGDSISFQSVLSNLDDDTEYNVRSYVIAKNVDTDSIEVWYNPVIKIIPTKPAIDEWFEQCLLCLDGGKKPVADARFDALVFNFGDSIFFGTGSKGGGILNNELIMYDPTTGEWDEDNLLAIPRFTATPTPPAEFRDGIGFAIEYQKTFDPPGTLTRSIFVGFGDHSYPGYSFKSATLYEYELEGNNAWREVPKYMNQRSGAICFVIDGYAYIGTGADINGNPLSNWYRFDPVADSDGLPETPSWNQLDNAPTIKRKNAVAFTMLGRGYFGLGEGEGGEFLNDFWVFTPSSDPTEPDRGSWNKLEDFPGTPRANAVAFAIGDQGYIGSGDNISGDYEVIGGYSGEIFNDFWRYNPYTDTWLQVRDYTADKTGRIDVLRPITRAIGYSLPSKKLGFVGYGIVPADYENYAGITIDEPESTSSSYAQKDFWRYQPFDDSAKK